MSINNISQLLASKSDVIGDISAELKGQELPAGSGDRWN